MHHGMLAKENDLSRTVSNVRVIALQRHAREPYQSGVRDARCGSRAYEKMRWANQKLQEGHRIVRWANQKLQEGHRIVRWAIRRSREGCGIVESIRRARKGCGIVRWANR